MLTPALPPWTWLLMTSNGQMMVQARVEQIPPVKRGRHWGGMSIPLDISIKRKKKVRRGTLRAMQAPWRMSDDGVGDRCDVSVN